MKSLEKIVSFLTEDTNGYRTQILITLIIGISCFNNGLYFGWSSPSLIQLKNDDSLNITKDQESLLVLLFPLGAVLGCVVYPFLGRVSRKILLCSSPLGYLSGWILIGFTNNLQMFYIGRFLGGIADGICITLMPAYLAEIVSAKIRGTAISFIVTCYVLGSLSINILETYLSVSVAAKISAIPVIIFLILSVLWLPESPYCLLRKNLRNDAQLVLKKLRNTDDVNEELDRIEGSVKINIKLTDFLMDKSNRKALLLALFFRIAQNMIGYSPIEFHLQEILQSTGSHISTSTTSSIYLTIQIIFGLISMNYADKFGRRRPLMLSLIGSGFSVFAIAVFFQLKFEYEIDMDEYSVIPVFALCLFVATFCLGMQQIPSLYLSELFRPQAKGLGTAIGTIGWNGGALVANQFYYFLRNNYGIAYAFHAFGVMTILVLILSIFWAPETRGKTLEDIQENL